MQLRVYKVTYYSSRVKPALSAARGLDKQAAERQDAALNFIWMWMPAESRI